jgi:site-specific DNA-cytosine methylase
MTLYVIDLFCGAGGFSFGASQADNTHVAVAVDAWDKALKVHQDNHPNTIHLNMELGKNIKKTTQLILSHLPKLKKGDKVHVHASPPCQQLSIVNKNKNEELGLKMVLWTLKFVQQSCFDSYTIEQVNNKHVRDLYTNHKIPFILCDFSKLGVCQSRRRLIASNKSSLLEQLSRLNIPFKPLHKILGKPILKTSLQFQNNETIRKYNPNEPFYTILTGIDKYNIFLTNEKSIKLPLEVAQTLQGFPAKYFDTCDITKKNRLKMIGNAVPCQIGYIICIILQQI